jgi:hypothetical protein
VYLYAAGSTNAWISSSGWMAIGSDPELDHDDNVCTLPQNPAENSNIPPADTIFPFWDTVESKTGGVCYATSGTAPNWRCLYELLPQV